MITPGGSLEYYEVPKRKLGRPKANEATIGTTFSNDAAHRKPKVGKTYGIKFGSKRIRKIFIEDEVQIVEFTDYQGNKNTESLTMFNRWAQRKNISIP